MFVNGDLEGKFIMDRNLGARDPKRSLDAKGVVQFQYGRKDPIYASANVGDYITPAYIGRTSTNWTVENKSGPIAISESVTNPMMYILSNNSNWANDVASEIYLWNDFEQDYRDGGKSIFDPSPYGWKIPANGVWSSFSMSSMTDYDSNTETMGYGYPRENPFAYYYLQGERTPSSGAMVQTSVGSYHWTSTPTTTTISYRIYIVNNSSNYIGPGTSASRALTFNIRPVLHYE